MLPLLEEWLSETERNTAKHGCIFRASARVTAVRNLLIKAALCDLRLCESAAAHAVRSIAVH
jgi:hypothetical protein